MIRSAGILSAGMSAFLFCADRKKALKPNDFKAYFI